MKKITIDQIASVAPLLIFLLVLGIIGLLYGIFNIMMESVMDTSTNMNLLMWRAWVICIVIILIIMVSWLLMRAQKSEYMYGGRL